MNLCVNVNYVKMSILLKMWIFVPGDKLPAVAKAAMLIYSISKNTQRAEKNKSVVY